MGDDTSDDSPLSPLIDGDHDRLGLPSSQLYEHDPSQGEGHRHVSVRTEVYKDRELRIETEYRVSIDSYRLAEAFHVLDNGKVTYHGLPAYSVPSALELLRLVVDRMERTEARVTAQELVPPEPPHHEGSEK